MYVCLCKGVSSRVVRRCVEQGARTVEDLGARCGAGTSCGSCRRDLAAAIRDVEAAEREAAPIAAK